VLQPPGGQLFIKTATELVRPEPRDVYARTGEQQKDSEGLGPGERKASGVDRRNCVAETNVWASLKTLLARGHAGYVAVLRLN
jgi:hypothetical protein